MPAHSPESDSLALPTLTRLHTEVAALLADFAQARASQWNALRQNLAEDQANRALQVASLLADFQQQRVTTTLRLFEQLRQENADRQQVVGRTLTELEQARQTQAGQLRQDLATDQAQRVASLAALLQYFATDRQTLAQAAATQRQTQQTALTEELHQLLQGFGAARAYQTILLREELAQATSQRRQWVDSYLAAAQRQRLERAANRQPRLPVVAKSEAAPVKLPAPALKPAAATPARSRRVTSRTATLSVPKEDATPVIPAAASVGLIESGSARPDELVLYLMTFPGALTLEGLETYFGVERIATEWTGFKNLLEELRPGSAERLELLRAARNALPGQAASETTPSELFAYLALHTDGATLEELEQQFRLARPALQLELCKLIDNGKVRRKDKLFIAI